MSGQQQDRSRQQPCGQGGGESLELTTLVVDERGEAETAYTRLWRRLLDAILAGAGSVAP